MILLFFAILAGVTAILAPSYLAVFIVTLGLSLDRHARPWLVVLGFMLGFGIFGPPLLAYGSLGPIPDVIIHLIGGVLLVLIGVWALFQNFKRSKQVPLPIRTTLPNTTPLDIPHSHSKMWPVVDFLGGFALGMVWIPCTGSIFRTLLTLAETGEFVLSSAIYFAGYAFGVGLTLVFFDRILTDIFRNLRNHHLWARMIPVGLAGLIVIFGVVFALSLHPLLNRLLFPVSPFTLFAL